MLMTRRRYDFVGKEQGARGKGEMSCQKVDPALFQYPITNSQVEVKRVCHETVHAFFQYKECEIIRICKAKVLLTFSRSHASYSLTLLLLTLLHISLASPETPCYPALPTPHTSCQRQRKAHRADRAALLRGCQCGHRRHRLLIQVHL